MKRKPFIMKGFCLGIILFGMHGCFYHAFLPYTSLTKFFIALLLTGMWFMILSICPFRELEQKARKSLSIPFLKYPVADMLILLTLFIMAGYALNHIVRIQQDAQVLYGAVSHQYDLYYGNESGIFTLRGYASNGSRLIFLVEMLLAFFMAKAFSRKHGMFLGTLPVAIVISGGLVLGKTPSMWDMGCIICGVLGMQMLTDVIRRGGRKGFRQKTAGSRQYRKVYPVVAVLMAFIFSVSSILSLSTADFCLQKEKELLKIQNNMERKVVDASVRTIQKIMMKLGIQQPGMLNNLAPSFTGETVLTITSDKKPEEDIYLRGFIGTKYEDGRWSNPADEEQRKSAFWDYRYQLMTQDYDYVMSYGDGNLTENTKMTIEYASGNRSSFGYLPCYSRLADESTSLFLLDGDHGFRRDTSVKKYQVEYLNWVSGTEEEFLGDRELFREGRLNAYFEKEENDFILEQYYNYILEQDTWLPEKGLEKTRELADTLLEKGEIIFEDEDGVSKDVLEIIQSMQRFFQTSTTYSQKLKMRASGEDYVENFLFRQKKGYCEHYATAGAVLFRAMGVPSRYVSGYKVSASDFIENEDGTYTAEVIDSKAHAWTEIYAIDGGWIVADMTPPDERQEVPPARDTNSMIAVTEEPDEDEFLGSSEDSSEQVSPEDEATPTPGNMKKVTDQEEEDSEEPDAGSDASLPGQKEIPGGSEEYENLWCVFQWIGIILIVMVIASVVWRLQAVLRHIRLKCCKDYRRYILEMNHLFERYLQCCGYRRVSKMTDREYVEFLKEIYPEGDQKGILERYYRILEQARFAQEAGSAEEIRWCKKLLYHMGANVVQRRSKARRFYVRWIRNWRRKTRKVSADPTNGKKGK